MLDDTPLAPATDLRAFLIGLSPHRFCMPCLAKVSEQPELPVREALQTLSDRLEIETGECRNCAETSQTYRIAEPLREAVEAVNFSTTSAQSEVDSELPARKPLMPR